MYMYLDSCSNIECTAVQGFVSMRGRWKAISILHMAMVNRCSIIPSHINSSSLEVKAWAAREERRNKREERSANAVGERLKTRRVPGRTNKCEV